MKPAVAVSAVLCLLLAPSAHAIDRPALGTPPLAGLIETAVLYPGGHRIRAKLDTGALTTSLGVTRQRVVARDGGKAVEFAIQLADGREIAFDRPLVRMAQIKKRGGGVSTRPVVMLKLCIGSIVRRTEVNLQDRSNFLYPLLVGRRFLAGAYAVDPARNDMLRPDCPADAEVGG